ncbi:MAG: hypothetical protein ACJA0S_001099 [Rickettsiales bacterium]|jgi:hypothetical protein
MGQETSLDKLPINKIEAGKGAKKEVKKGRMSALLEQIISEGKNKRMGENTTLATISKKTGITPNHLMESAKGNIKKLIKSYEEPEGLEKIKKSRADYEQRKNLINSKRRMSIDEENQGAVEESHVAKLAERDLGNRVYERS